MAKTQCDTVLRTDKDGHLTICGRDLVIFRGALVCRHCDALAHWPSYAGT